MATHRSATLPFRGAVVKLARLRAIRERKALSQQELAELAGVNRQTIINIETRHMEPYPRTIRKIAAALGVEPHELMEPEKP